MEATTAEHVVPNVNPQPPKPKGRYVLKPRWVKGQSGNPSGRSTKPRELSISQVRALARTYSKSAIEALVKALNDPRQRVAAATALLDRAYGKAAQPHTGEGGTGAVVVQVVTGLSGAPGSGRSQLRVIDAPVQLVAPAPQGTEIECVPVTALEPQSVEPAVSQSAGQSQPASEQADCPAVQQEPNSS